MKEQLVNAIADMREEEALKLAQEMLDAGEDPQAVLDAGREAMTVVGDRYEEGEYFLPELIIAGDVLKAIGDMVRPKLQAQAMQSEPLGKIVLGTVAGDIHDLGKDVVGFMLDISNFEVHDLGVDVPPEKFVQAIQEVNPGAVVVMMTGHRQEVEDLVNVALCNGAYACLYKPLEMDKVLVLVEEILDRRRGDGRGT